ncbi:uncharacterized protein LOC141849923 [Brevipalpus obovatus]|uniref:uncharacterized protein LOC141849923 n=1 Tax=Brevipalpus obovatus TaxID=246614 RepID=UPI003D9EFEAD
MEGHPRERCHEKRSYTLLNTDDDDDDDDGMEWDEIDFLSLHSPEVENAKVTSCPFNCEYALVLKQRGRKFDFSLDTLLTTNIQKESQELPGKLSFGDSIKMKSGKLFFFICEGTQNECTEYKKKNKSSIEELRQHLKKSRGEFPPPESSQVSAVSISEFHGLISPKNGESTRRADPENPGTRIERIEMDDMVLNCKWHSKQVSQKLDPGQDLGDWLTSLVDNYNIKQNGTSIIHKSSLNFSTEEIIVLQKLKMLSSADDPAFRFGYGPISELIWDSKYRFFSYENDGIQMNGAYQTIYQNSPISKSEIDQLFDRFTTVKEIPERYRYQCKICNLKFSSCHDIVTHLMSELEIKYRCVGCGTRYGHPAEVHRHLKNSCKSMDS